MIRQYQCVSWVPSDAPNRHNSKVQVDRILGFEKTTKRVALINLHAPNAKIRVLETAALESALKSSNAEPREMHGIVKKLTDAGKAYQEKIWNGLELFRQSDQSFLFNCHLRADMVRATMEKTGLQEPTIREGLKRLCKAGFRKEDILSRYGNCGIPREGGRAYRPGKKRGAKKKRRGIKTSEEPLSIEDKANLDKLIKTHLVGINNRQNTYKGVYDEHIGDYFNYGLTEDPNKRTAPSPSQFRHYIETSGWRRIIRDSRSTSAAKGTSGRGKNSQSTDLEPQGPGDVYQIDSTQADISITLSDTDHHIIGKATVYLVVDVYTHMICGVHVTLGAPCWEEACHALISVVRNKVKLCAEYGIPITEDHWPETPLPCNLVADRQEFIWKNSNLLMQRLGIRVFNTPKYRGDFKGMVESKIGGRMKVTWTFPGANDPLASKDERSAKADACLSLHRFTKLLLLDIIKVNNKVNRKIFLPRQAVLDKCPKKPAHITLWAKEKISGGGLSGDLDLVRRHLLPPAQHARIYPEGLRVSYGKTHEIYYVANGFVSKDLFKPSNGIPLETQVDTSLMNHVFVKHPETGEIRALPLDMKRSREYRGLSWEEGADHQARANDLDDAEAPKDVEQEKVWNGMTEDTLQSAYESRLQTPKSSRAAMLGGEKQNRQIARKTEKAGRSSVPVPRMAYNPRYEEE